MLLNHRRRSQTGMPAFRSLFKQVKDMGCGSSTPHPKDPTASRNGQVCDWFEDKIGFMNDALKDFINNEVGADTEGKFATTLLRPANAAHLSKAQGLLPLAKQEELVPLLEETVKASGAPGKPQCIQILCCGGACWGVRATTNKHRHLYTPSDCTSPLTR